MQLRIPGPTPCPSEVLQAMGKQMINHRGVEFAGIFQRVTAGAKEVFQTKGDVLLLTCAGTGGLEAAVVNSFSPGDKVLGVTIGAFGDRFISIAQQYGMDVTKLAFEWGRAADPDKVRAALKADPSIKGVLLTHNETSTGITNDLAALAGVVKEYDKLLVVDAVSSVSSIDVQTDNWQCDVVVSGSQKGWMVPPGLALIAVSEKAWAANKVAKAPRFYLDFARAKKDGDKGQTPWTPAVTTFFALDAGLAMIKKEGLKNVFARHSRVGQKARSGVKSLGLSLFAEESHASNTVTAVKVPADVDCSRLLKTMRDELGIELAGGQSQLEGQVFRIGHLGLVSEADIDQVIKALKQALPKAHK